MTSWNEEKLYEVAYNAHETAEASALAAIESSLREASLEALTCLGDPSWHWETRSSMSVWIIELAGEVLNEKLEALVAA